MTWSKNIFLCRRELNFTKECPRNDYSCNCTDYLSFSEPPYDENATETRLCGQTNVFTSKTRVVVIKYVYQANRYNVFNLTYATKSEWHPLSERKSQIQMRTVFVFMQETKFSRIERHRMQRSQAIFSSRHSSRIFIHAIWAWSIFSHATMDSTKLIAFWRWYFLISKYPFHRWLRWAQ